VVCGDGIVSPGETCDPPHTCPVTCDDADACTVDLLTGDAQQCTAECLNTPILVCEDDDGCCAPGCDATTDNDCTVVCGDGIVAGQEQCDDMGESETCDADCTYVVCGDGYVNQAASEECDDGGESVTCNTDCTVPVCGDGKLNQSAGEECDDGGTEDGDGCSATCTIELPDTDGDGITDDQDNCPGVYNPGQEDFDGDGFGYACDLTCAASMNFVHDFVADDVIDLQASGPIVYEGIIAAGADISFDGGGGVVLNSNVFVDLGAILSIFRTGCNP
jgi:cysteine-rich repeat protein